MEAQARDVQFAHEREVTEGASFEAFFAAEWARLFRAVILLTGSREEAEDVTQGAFLKVLEHWDTLDHQTDLEGYLFRTALTATGASIAERSSRPSERSQRGEPD